MACHYSWWLPVSHCSCLEDNLLPSIFPWFRSSLTCTSAGWSGGDGPSLLRPLGVFGFALHFIAWVRGCVFLRGWVLMSVHGWSFAEVALTLPLWPLPRGWVSAGHSATKISKRGLILSAETKTFSVLQGQAVTSAVTIKARTSFWRKAFLRHRCQCLRSLVTLERSLRNGKNSVLAHFSKNESDDLANYRPKRLTIDPSSVMERMQSIQS